MNLEGRCFGPASPHSRANTSEKYSSSYLLHTRLHSCHRVWSLVNRPVGNSLDPLKWTLDDSLPLPASWNCIARLAQKLLTSFGRSVVGMHRHDQMQSAAHPYQCFNSSSQTTYHTDSLHICTTSIDDGFDILAIERVGDKARGQNNKSRPWVTTVG